MIALLQSLLFGVMQMCMCLDFSYQVDCLFSSCIAKIDFRFVVLTISCTWSWQAEYSLFVMGVWTGKKWGNVKIQPLYTIAWIPVEVHWKRVHCTQFAMRWLNSSQSFDGWIQSLYSFYECYKFCSHPFLSSGLTGDISSCRKRLWFYRVWNTLSQAPPITAAHALLEGA